MVAPFMLGKDMALSGVSGVYNAVEVLGEPIGSVMFYGPGAGAGATASAVVGDLMQVMCSGRQCAQPAMLKTADGVCDFADFECRQYIALSGADEAAVRGAFGSVQFITADDECAFVTAKMREGDVLAALLSLGADVKSRIRIA